MISSRPRTKRILSPPAAPHRLLPICTEAIAAEREKLVAEMNALHERGQLPARSVRTLRNLLTRSWGGASWRARAQILRTADWFIRLERTLPVSLPDRTRPN